LQSPKDCHNENETCDRPPEKDMLPRIKVYRCSTNEEILASVGDALALFNDCLPQSRNALILLKPNLNSHMNALSGNTSDLRILASVIRELQTRGYRNIVIGEGTNSGFYRNKISVIDRLRVNRLAELLEVKTLDLNSAPGHEITLDRGLKASAAAICFEADLIINIPKLKTHFEAGITVCMKNLIGCMVSQINKKKIHDNLPRNIVKINQAIHCRLNIIDGLIAMEGNGPTRGIPINYGRLIVGDDPFALDYFCSRLMGFTPAQVAYLSIVLEELILTDEARRSIDSIPLEEHGRQFLPPKSNLLVRTIFNTTLQRYFQALRRMRLAEYFCSTKIGGKILFTSGIRQDVFSDEETSIEEITHDAEKCRRCGKCRSYCPAGRPLPEGFTLDQDRCLNCLYCFSVCPEGAIGVEGNLGFFNEQLRQFGELIRKIT
jgi:uncharacterized protein (DUF362 family)/ferredoxin